MLWVPSKPYSCSNLWYKVSGSAWAQVSWEQVHAARVSSALYSIQPHMRWDVHTGREEGELNTARSDNSCVHQ